MYSDAQDGEGLGMVYGNLEWARRAIHGEAPLGTVERINDVRGKSEKQERNADAQVGRNAC